jgi:hypothetical protein
MIFRHRIGRTAQRERLPAACFATILNQIVRFDTEMLNRIFCSLAICHFH